VSGLRAGIAGYGLAGEVFHAPLIAAVDGIEVAGIVTTSEERAARAAAAYPEARVAVSVDELWNEMDVLVVAAPNRAHVTLALAAFERGLPVVMDKPIASSLAEAERLLDSGGRLTVFQNRRLDGDFLTLRGLIERGELGAVTRFESRFERFRPEVDPSGWRELADAAEGGGLLLDLGAHLVDQARVLFGHPRRVYAELARRRPGAEVEDDVFLALEHEGGVDSHLWMSAVAPLHGPRFRVSGLEAGFASHGLDPQEDQLSRGIRPGDPGYGAADGLLPGAYQRFYEGVVAWLRDGAPPPVDPRDSLACMRVLDAARISAATHSVIELEGST
jgi:scyllo-inositol 2-dehydrogenase (NADP+)